MKAKLGTFLMLLGAAMICGSLGLLLFNQQQQTMAARSVDAVMPQLVTAIHESKRLPEESQPPQELPLQQREMVVQEIDGHNYIGFVGIPALELELPVMADWTYPQLKIAPCRFTGSIFTDDLVIMAHNFERHFGRIRDLKPGDTVTFTDMEGQTISYEVVVLDILHPTAVENMTAGEYDLTLFTCTYGGKSRVTVRCDRME